MFKVRSSARRELKTPKVLNAQALHRGAFAAPLELRPLLVRYLR